MFRPSPLCSCLLVFVIFSTGPFPLESAARLLLSRALYFWGSCRGSVSAGHRGRRPTECSSEGAAKLRRTRAPFFLRRTVSARRALVVACTPAASQPRMQVGNKAYYSMRSFCGVPGHFYARGFKFAPALGVCCQNSPHATRPAEETTRGAFCGRQWVGGWPAPLRGDTATS